MFHDELHSKDLREYEALAYQRLPLCIPFLAELQARNRRHLSRGTFVLLASHANLALHTLE